MLISVVIYYYAGPLVTSPALGSANKTFTKIAFGFAIPTIPIAGVVNGNVACKYIYIRLWRKTNVIHQKSFKSLGSWIAICAGLWILAWILAEAIPSFNILLGLIAALFGVWFSCEFIRYFSQKVCESDNFQIPFLLLCGFTSTKEPCWRASARLCCQS